MATKDSLVLLIAVVAPLVAMGQLGKNEAQCKKIWGTPEGELDSDGIGNLKYSAVRTTITLEFDHGLVVSGTYAKPGLDEHDVDALLKLNSNQHDWHLWTQPGVSASLHEPRMWMRQDELAMAELDEGAFRVFGSLVEPEPEKPPVVQMSEAPSATRQDEVAVVPKVEVVEKEPVARPERLPEVGDSKQTVFSMLGDPSGTMETGGNEILVYNWGSVWIAGDKVVSIK